MPERVLDRVPTEFQLRPDSQRLRQELLDADPSLEGNKSLLDEIHGLIVYNNYTALKYNSPEHEQIRSMGKRLGRARKGKIKCVDGRRGGKQQDENPTHTEPGGFIKRTPRHYRRTRDESGGRHIPRSPFLRGGIRAAALENEDLIEFAEGHFMKEPPKDEKGNPTRPVQRCGQAEAMQRNDEITDTDLIRGHITKLKEITVPAITDWYNDCRDMQGKNILARVCLPIMMDTETRGYVLDLDKRDQRTPLDVAELVKVYRSRIESDLGRLVGSYGSKAEWLLDPERMTDLALTRYEITRGLMQDPELKAFRDDVLTYLVDHYSDLTIDQRTGVLSEFADDAALLYLQGSAYGEAEHSYKWHNERCMVISPEGNPPFVYYPDIQSFVATPPEPERTNIYANTMIDIWNHYHKEAIIKNSHTRMPDAILMFLTTSVAGELNRSNQNYIAALNNSEELLYHMINDHNEISKGSKITKADLYKTGRLQIVSLLYDYQSRIVRAVVNNRAIANR